jgi:uncharacterized protein (TIGR03067 family)
MFGIQLLIPTVSVLMLFTPPAVEKEMERLQGSWVLVGGEEKGMEITAEDAKKESCVFVIEKDRLTIQENGKSKWTFRYTIDPSTKPSSINLTYAHGRDEGKTNYAIYRVDKACLKVCFSRKLLPNDPKERPKEFSGKAPKDQCDLHGLCLFIFKREKG